MKVEQTNFRRKSRRNDSKVREVTKTQEKKKSGRKSVNFFPDIVEDESEHEAQDQDEEYDEIAYTLPPIQNGKLRLDARPIEPKIRDLPDQILYGTVCNTCSKIGAYAKNEEIRKAIEYSSNANGRMRDKCIICKTYQNRNFNSGDVDISSTIMYSHDFYDKFSREKKIVSTTNETGETNETVTKESEEHTQEVLQSEDIKSENSNVGNNEQISEMEEQKAEEEKKSEASPWPLVPVDELSSRDQGSSQRNRETLAMSKVGLKSSQPKLPNINNKSQICNIVEANPRTLKVASREKQPPPVTDNEKTEPETRSVFPKLSMSVPNKERHAKPQKKLTPPSSKKYSELFYSVYQKRAMKGSTVRKSDILIRPAKPEPQKQGKSDCNFTSIVMLCCKLILLKKLA